MSENPDNGRLPNGLAATARSVLLRLRAMPLGAKLLLGVFLFTTGYSLFHLGKGIATFDLHLIIGGVIFTAVSIPMILICWHGNQGETGPDGQD